MVVFLAFWSRPVPQATSLLAPHPNFVESDPVVGATGVTNAVAAVPGGRRVGQFGVVHVRAIDELSQRTTTAASQWCHSGIAVVPYCQHPLVKISLSTKITALSKSL